MSVEFGQSQADLTTHNALREFVFAAKYRVVREVLAVCCERDGLQHCLRHDAQWQA